MEIKILVVGAGPVYGIIFKTKVGRKIISRSGSISIDPNFDSIVEEMYESLLEKVAREEAKQARFGQV